MDEEKLIGLVQRFECLYNISSPTYSDRMLKANAWERTSQEMGKPVSDCQRCWKLLRDNFRRAISTRKFKSGSAGGRRRPIKYEQLMEFLKPHLQHRKQTSNLDSSSEDTQSSNLQLTSDTDETRQKESSRPSSQMTNYSQPKLGRASDILEKYIQSKEHEHPVDSFFKTMAATVKNLPERMQARIKRDVFKIISNAEIEYYDEHVTERASIQSIRTTSYDVDDSEDSNFSPYIPSKQTSNISVPQYTYTPSAITPSTSKFNPSPQVEFCAISDQTKNYTFKETSQTFIPSAITPSTFKFKPSPQVEFVTICDQPKTYTSKEITETCTPSTITPNPYTPNF